MNNFVFLGIVLGVVTGAVAIVGLLVWRITTRAIRYEERDYD